MGKTHVNVAHVEETNQGDPIEDHPRETQEDEPPVEEEQNSPLFDEEEFPHDMARELHLSQSQYQWDKEASDGEAPSL